MYDDSWEEAMALNIRRVLTPVQPSTVFRDRLRSGLQVASQQRAAQRALRATQTGGVPRWWMGAAALGVTLAAGSVIAWVVRSRGVQTMPRMPVTTAVVQTAKQAHT